MKEKNMQTSKYKKIIIGQIISNFLAISMFIFLIVGLVLWALFINNLQAKYSTNTSKILANTEILDSGDASHLNSLNFILISSLILYLIFLLISIVFNIFIATFSYKFNWKFAFIFSLGSIFLTRILGIVAAIIFYRNEKNNLNKQEE
ncbi:hypothetical protein DA803_02185 [[Mycoplasma] phocae]|uniref:Uncharacterized protein n=1 Tax=[Mycoplasma] phocae TaxID=142651 RepID=A0A2Z5IQE3_9BACT|nr:hypothetical protein [[Mycoplasma] phocae]AXE60890.1 hypothetical protein DA803_02185 [[Mycoplasma] phocae]